MEKTDAVVIGAGPVGLFQIFQLGLQGLSCPVSYTHLTLPTNREV